MSHVAHVNESLGEVFKGDVLNPSVDPSWIRNPGKRIKQCVMCTVRFSKIVQGDNLYTEF